jgi:cytochrome c biogenesis protein CcdA
MGIEAQLPTLLTVIITAAIDSINPCAIGVLILMISVILGSGGSVRRMVWLGFLYTASVFTVYLAAGIGLVYYFASIPLYITEYLSIFVAILLVFAGLLEIKDYFWYGRGFSLGIPASAAKKLHDYATHTSAFGIIFLGAFVSAVELPCTGAPYLAIITVLSQYFDFTAFLLLVLYNIIFVLPLIIIICLIAAGKKIEEVQQWKQNSRGTMRLFIGLLLLALSWFLILIANGTINLG